MCFSAMLARMYGLQAFSNASSGVAPALWACVEESGSTHTHTYTHNHTHTSKRSVESCLQLPCRSWQQTWNNTQQQTNPDGWRTKVRNILHGRNPIKNKQQKLTKQQYAAPSPRVFNVGNGVLELALRNLVPSHSLPSRLLRHANIERRGVRGMHKDHLLHPLHKCARCELLSVNSPRHAGLALDACMHTTRKAHTHCGSNGKTNLKTLSQLARQGQHYKTRLIH